MEIEEQKNAEGSGKKRVLIGLLGCLGAFFLHMLIGSVYQWGIINIYVTSYYRLGDSNISLEGNAIAYPVMMLCIGVTMKIGLHFAEATHPLIVSTIVVIGQCVLIFCCSFMPTMFTFIILYGVLFGLFSGMNFMLTIYECNKYFPGKKMFINGFILAGTGLGPVVFGLFSYNYLNPTKIPSKEGYYIGSFQLQQIANKIPVWLKWLSLLYTCIGVLGLIFISKLYVENRKKENKERDQAIAAIEKQKQQNHADNNLQSAQNIKNNLNQLQPEKNEKQGQFDNQNTKQTSQKTTQVIWPTTLKQVACAKVTWLKVAINFFGSCGVFFISGNYKTYVKHQINNDEFLTYIGVVGAIGNGCGRFIWNTIFHHTGYRFAMVLNLSIQIVVYSTIRFTVVNEGVYLLLVFFSSFGVGAFLGMTPTFMHIVFGQKMGSHVYGFYWQIFGLANLLQYAYVAGLTPKISFNNVIYICLGMTVISLLLVIFGNFEAPWKNPQDELGYFRKCKKAEDQPQQNIKKESSNNIEQKQKIDDLNKIKN